MRRSVCFALALAAAITTACGSAGKETESSSFPEESVLLQGERSADSTLPVEGVQWSIEDHVLTFYGAGRIDRSLQFNKHRDYSGVQRVVIGDEITAVETSFTGTQFFDTVDNWTDGVLYCGDWEMRARADISGVYVIPDGTRGISAGGFFACIQLSDIVIPDSVTSIGELAFASCSGLSTITIPDGVTYIGGRPFVNCTNLSSIKWKGETYSSVEEFEAAFGGFQ